MERSRERTREEALCTRGSMSGRGGGEQCEVCTAAGAHRVAPAAQGQHSAATVAEIPAGNTLLLCAPEEHGAQAGQRELQVQHHDENGGKQGAHSVLGSPRRTLRLQKGGGGGEPRPAAGSARRLEAHPVVRLSFYRAC